MMIISNIQLQAVIPDQSDAISVYFEAHLPTSKDEEISDLIAAYGGASAEERRDFAEQLVGFQRGWFDTYAFRMAMLSVRQHTYALLFKGFVARLIYMSTSRDDREDLMSLSTLFRSLALLNSDPASRAEGHDRDLVREVEPLAPNAKARQILDRFVERQYADHPLSYWGFNEINSPAGIVYIWGEQPVPEQWLT